MSFAMLSDPQFEESGVHVGIYGSVHVVSHLAGRPSLPVGVHADGYQAVHGLSWPTAPMLLTTYNVCLQQDKKRGARL